MAKVASTTENAAIVEEFRSRGIRVYKYQSESYTHVSIDAKSTVSRDVFVRLGRLPRLEHLVVHDADVTDEQIEPIRKLHTLKRLELNGRYLTDECLKYVGGISGLRRLSLPNPAYLGRKMQITDFGLRYVSGLRNLESLDISDHQITDSGLRHLSDMSDLKLINLGGAITDSGLDHLVKLPSLTAVHLNGELFTDAAMKKLPKFRTLEHLSLTGTNVSDDGLAYLSQIPALSSLTVYSYSIGDRGIRHLENHSSLKRLHLFAGELSDEGFASVARIANLKHLDLRLGSYRYVGGIHRFFGNLEVTSAGYGKLAELPQLEELRIRFAVLDENCLDEISRITSLKELDLLDLRTPVGGKAADALARRLPNTQIRSQSGSGGVYVPHNAGAAQYYEWLENAKVKRRKSDELRKPR